MAPAAAGARRRQLGARALCAAAAGVCAVALRSAALAFAKIPAQMPSGRRGALGRFNSAYAQLLGAKVQRASDGEAVALPSLWGPQERAAVVMLRHFG